MDLLRKYFLRPDVEDILKLKISPSREDDVLAWGPDRRGVFSVRSAYKLAWDNIHRTSSCAVSRAPDGNRVVWDTVWGCPAPPKVRVFAWRLATNSLATWENKKKRNLEVSDICVICGLEREDTYHTFCRWPMAKQIGEAMRRVWPLKAIDAIPCTGTEWPLHALDQAPEQERMMMLMTWWQIWHIRNEVVHQKPAPPVEASRRFMCSYVDSFLMIKQNPRADPTKGKLMITYDHMQPKGKKHVRREKPSKEVKKWSKPPLGWVKLNVDGSWIEEGHKGGTGMILRDEEGSILAAACRHLRICASPLEAEAQACLDGLAQLLEWTDKPDISAGVMGIRSMYRGFVQRVIEFIKLDSKDLLEAKVKHPSVVYTSIIVLFLRWEEAYSRGTDNYSGVFLSQGDFQNLEVHPYPTMIVVQASKS
ncbi:hypothetical protein ACQ4PT_008892 [Festuca glaucescens]